MFFGPVFTAEMRTSGRRLRYLLLRCAYAALLFGMLSLWWFSTIYVGRLFRSGGGTQNAVAEFAERFSQAFAFAQIGVILLVAPGLVADGIARERERRTIEYLFAADLTNWEIIRGKLLARLMHIVYLLMAGWPILAITMLFGGVGPIRLQQTMLLTTTSTLAVAAVAMFSSVFNRKPRGAVVHAYVVLGLLLLAPMILGWILSAVLPFEFAQHLQRPFALATVANPVVALIQVLFQQPLPPATSHWAMVAWVAAVHLTLGLVCIGGSTWGLRWAYLRRVSQGSAKPLRRRRFQLWTPALGEHAVLWKELSFSGGTRQARPITLAILLLIVGGLLAFAMWMLYQAVAWSYGTTSKDDVFGYCVTVSMIGLVIGLLALAGRAAGLVTSERDQQCWTTLISTPLSPRDVVAGKIAGNVYAARWLLPLLAGFWVLAAVARPSGIIAMPFVLATAAILVVFVSALGVYLSLWLRSSLKALSATLGTCFFLGGAYTCCCSPVVGILIAFLFAFRNSIAVANVLEYVTAINYSLAVPYLLAVPWLAEMTESSRRSNEFGPLLLGYVLGNAFYLMAAAGLWWLAVARFDKLAGRLGSRSTKVVHRENPAREQSVPPPPGN